MLTIDIKIYRIIMWIYLKVMFIVLGTIGR